jgi:hypothetical protein
MAGAATVTGGGAKHVGNGGPANRGSAGLAKAPDPIEFFLLEGRGHTDSTLKALISTKHACRCVSVTAQSWAPTTGHQAALVGVAGDNGLRRRNLRDY